MKIFSVPLNPKLSETQYYEFLTFLQEHKDYIYDVYFTCRMPPFNQDAMGDVFVSEQDTLFAIEAALNIQRGLGIPISATFNNIQIPPTQANLDLFISNFKVLYDAGVRNVTIPHTHWMATGQIKKAFPDLFVKNTILRDVNRPSDIVALAQAGFDYVNLDRDLMRDRDTLLRVKAAKEHCHKLGLPVKISLLANEGCLGGCPMMVEHFEYNNNRVSEQPQYFNDPISRVSCPKWDNQDPAVKLKTANFPPWREDWDEFINDLGIDTFKMHGRESVTRLYETMDIVRRWANNNPLLFDGFEEYIEDKNLVEKPINIWRNKIKNCKFDCWECQYCDKIYSKKAGNHISPLVTAVSEIVSDSGSVNVHINIKGLTSPRVQEIINKTAAVAGNYLEIGSAAGATFASALSGNTIKAWAVDNWSAQIQPQSSPLVMPENKKNTFAHNIKKYLGSSQVQIIDSDYLSVDLSKITEPIRFMFYDGPHEMEDTKRAVEYYVSVLADEAVLIFDDANWNGVVDGANEGIATSGLDLLYSKMILNPIESMNNWWNGLYITVVRKK